MPQQQSLIKGLALLSLSALLFATMGVLIRLASHSVDNATVVFMRNLTGTILLAPFVLAQEAPVYDSPLSMAETASIFSEMLLGEKVKSLVSQEEYKEYLNERL